ncbi:TPA: Shedu anti-phage system protein SduA domain-containing protein, partial [Aeromonas veronii]
QINRFIETWGNKNSSETEITSFLAKDENRFILTMNFRAKQAFPELTCEWQSENKQAIRPDFFVVKPDGYADIVEFKLPFVKGKTIVGGVNRETYSAWLNSYISQTRVYSSYFDDPNNRSWFERKYGFKVHKPRRILVVGRRTDFDSEIWREIASDYRDIDIINFDDFVDSVLAQFYM